MNLLESLYATDRFSELEPLIDSIKHDVSFFGKRYIYLQDKTNQVFSIHVLAQRMLELIEHHRFEYTKDERQSGIRISEKINQIYEENDKILASKWFITRFFCYLFAPQDGCSARFEWYYDQDTLKMYTMRQYKEEFKEEPIQRYSDFRATYPTLGSVRLYRYNE